MSSELFHVGNAPRFGLFRLHEIFHLAIQFEVFITRLLHRPRLAVSELVDRIALNQ